MSDKLIREALAFVEKHTHSHPNGSIQCDAFDYIERLADALSTPPEPLQVQRYSLWNDPTDDGHMHQTSDGDWCRYEDVLARLRSTPQTGGWHPIETAPYDEVCLFLHVDGHIFESFIYDGTADDMFGKGQVSHWMPKPPLPEPPKQQESES